MEGGLELKPDDQAGAAVDERTDDVPVILTEPVERENTRNEIEEDERASAEEDELFFEDEVEASAEEIWTSVGVMEERTFSFGKGDDAGTRETVDETLEGIKRLLPDIARILGEERKSL
jgi:hypothetical protein